MFNQFDVQLEIFDYKFRLYTSRINEFCPHCHWLYFIHIEFWTMCFKKVILGT